MSELNRYCKKCECERTFRLKSESAREHVYECRHCDLQYIQLTGLGWVVGIGVPALSILGVLGFIPKMPDDNNK